METIQTEITENEVGINTHNERQSQIRKLKQKRLKKVVLSLASFSIFFLLTTVFSQYQIYQLNKLVAYDGIDHPPVAVTPNQIVESVSRHILLPDTVPQIASIEDAKKLRTAQDFFKNAVDGDVVLVYETTIIVYRPSQDLVIAVGDITGTSK